MSSIELFSFSTKGHRVFESVSVTADGSILISQDTYSVERAGEESIDWEILIRPEHHYSLRTALRDNVRNPIETGDNTMDSIVMMEEEFKGHERAFSTIKALLAGCNVKYQFSRW